MTLLTILVATVFGLAAFGREAWLGEALHRALVEWPAEHINRGPLRAAAQLLGFLVLCGIAVAAPEIVGLAATVDLALFVELSMALMIAGSRGLMRAARLLMAARPGVLPSRPSIRMQRVRQRRQRKVRRRSAPQNPEPWPWAFA